MARNIKFDIIDKTLNREFMLKKFFLILIIIILFGASAVLLIWYFKGVKETSVALEQAISESQKTEPKEVEVQIYFGNTKMNPNPADCKIVYPVKRIIQNDLIIRRRAIEELLKGPTPTEKEQGYFSSIPDKEEIIAFREMREKEFGQPPYQGDEIKIKSLKMLSGVVYIDFSGEMKAYGGGSCRVLNIKSQISETLKQFPRVGGVIILIEGDEHALQP